MATNKKLVSVVMPTFNAEKYIREAVESIINQTYCNWELIIVDDDSTDLTRQIINEYAYMDDRIRLIEGEKKGIGGAINIGIERAKGSYIARMDADDISLPLRLEKQVDFMEKHNDVGVCATQFREYAFNKVQSPNICDTFIDQDIKAKMIFSNAVGHPTIMFRKKVFEDGWRYAENVIAEDYDLWTRMIPDIKFECLEDVLLYYRKENQNNSLLVDLKQIILIDRQIIKACITRLFKIDSSHYRNEDFCENGAFYFQVKDAYRYLIRQVDLLNQIDIQNQKMKVLSCYALRKRLQIRWRLLLNFMEITDDILEENGALFLGDLNGMFDGIRSLQGYKDKLKEIQDYIKKIFTTSTRVVFYGMGKEGKETFERFLTLQKRQIVNCKLEAIIDRNKRNIFVGSKDYEVCDPQCMKELEFDFVIISTRVYYDEIRKQLIDMGIMPGNLLSGNILRLIE